MRSNAYSFYYDNDFNRIIETIYGEGFSRVKINPAPLYQIEIEDAEGQKGSVQLSMSFG